MVLLSGLITSVLAFEAFLLAYNSAAYRRGVDFFHYFWFVSRLSRVLQCSSQNERALV